MIRSIWKSSSGSRDSCKQIVFVLVDVIRLECDVSTDAHAVLELVARQTQTLVFVELREQVPQSQVAVADVVEEQLQRVAQQRTRALASLHHEVAVRDEAAVDDGQPSFGVVDLVQELLELLVYFNALKTPPSSYRKYSRTCIWQWIL